MKIGLYNNNLSVDTNLKHSYLVHIIETYLHNYCGSAPPAGMRKQALNTISNQFNPHN